MIDPNLSVAEVDNYQGRVPLSEVFVRLFVQSCVICVFRKFFFGFFSVILKAFRKVFRKVFRNNGMRHKPYKRSI